MPWHMEHFDSNSAFASGSPACRACAGAAAAGMAAKGSAADSNRAITVVPDIVGLFPVLLSLFGRGSGGGSAVEWQTVATGLLGLFLFGAMAMAVGMFVSALTESVIVAALLSFIFLFCLWVVTIFAVGNEGPVKEITSAISASEHLGSFLQGRLELKDVVYYLSFVALGLYLTDRAVEGHRWA